MIESKKNSYLSVPKNNLISFIIGGNNRHYKFTKESVHRLNQQNKTFEKKIFKI